MLPVFPDMGDYSNDMLVSSSAAGSASAIMVTLTEASTSPPDTEPCCVASQ